MTLWEQFNLQHNPDPGAGILTCIRYDEARIRGHQQAVIGALQYLGVTMFDMGEGVGVRIPNEDASVGRRADALLEELSCINEALEYVEVGFGRYNTVGELCTGLAGDYVGLLGERRTADAYDLLTKVIPQIASDLAVAQAQNNVLTSGERASLQQLVQYARRSADTLARPFNVVVLDFR